MHLLTLAHFALEAWRFVELLLLFFAQAAAEIESRAVLLERVNFGFSPTGLRIFAIIEFCKILRSSGTR